MTDTPDRPFVIELAEEVDPSTAAPVPDPLPDGAAMQAAARIAVQSLVWATRVALSFIFKTVVKVVRLNWQRS